MQPWLVLKKLSLFFLISWFFIITLLSLIDLSNIEIDIKNSSILKLDKIVHFLFYFLLTGFLINHLKEKIKNYLLYSLIIAIIYGIIIEIFQDIVPTKRSFDYFDILANFTGSFTMLLIFLKKIKKNNF
ncbi:MAG: VanZ family protein [Flavobacterium sp.]|jgi:VanZ family protein